MPFATSGILQFFVMSSYYVLRAQCYCTQCSSYTETYQKPTLSPPFDNYLMQNRNVLPNVTFFCHFDAKKCCIKPFWGFTYITLFYPP